MDGVGAEIESPDGPIWLWAGYRYKEMCKLVPGARWDRDRAQWYVPLSWAACKALRGVFHDQLQVGQALVDWATNELTTRVEPATNLRLATEALSWAPWADDLYGFQRAGVEFLKVSEQAILGDEMGTGKTVQIAALLRRLVEDGQDPFPCLVVSPNAVKTNWAREMDRWGPPGTDVQVIGGGAAQRRKALDSIKDVAVVHYEATWRHSRLAGYGNIHLTDAEKAPKELNEVPWRTIVVDEAHRIKNPKAKQTRAVWFLGHQPTVRWRYALTGTPVANAPDDMWSLLHFLSPAEWPGRTKFIDRYCLVSITPYGLDVIGVRPETKQEFFETIDPRFRRMPKDLVLPFLPPKTRTIREAPMTAKQAKAYKQMDATMIADLDEKTEGQLEWTAATLPITKRLRLMQFSSAYAELNEEQEVRLTFPSNKVDALEELIEDLGDEALVVFAQSRQLITLAGERLTKMGITHSYIVGGMTDVERDASMQSFQSGHSQVMLCTIQAGGEGITLTRARHLVFLQRSDSMLGNLQAEDRVHRIGSEIHEHVHIIDFVTPGTVEEDQIIQLHVKFDRLQEIVRDKETLRAAGRLEELAKLEAEETNLATSYLVEGVNIDG